MNEIVELEPQEGPQSDFLCSKADIAIYGGAAGGGKSWALVAEPMRWSEKPGFEAVLFRRTSPELRGGGGLWDESLKIYRGLEGEPLGKREWTFPSGAHVQFTHLEHENTVHSHQSKQYAYIAFDELTHFTSKQFWYMLSRSRSTCGIKPYVRAATNPDPDSFVAELVGWWIGTDGLPIKERSGVLRWFVRVDDVLHWGSSKAELAEDFPDERPLSLTFVPARLEDNPILEKIDPTYRAKLRALPLIERSRLLEGNWKVRAKGGMLFRREWFGFVDAPPAKVIERWRTWDLAATEPTSSNSDPDWTSGVMMSRTENGLIYVEDLVTVRRTPHGVRGVLKATAELDGPECSIGFWQDPGQAGKDQVATFVKMLAGRNVRSRPARSSKLINAQPFSAQTEAGNVLLVRAPWNERFITTHEGFPDAKHDDDVDASSLGMIFLTVVEEPEALCMF